MTTATMVAMDSCDGGEKESRGESACRERERERTERVLFCFSFEQGRRRKEEK
jgi:hypothetical protein